MSQVTSQGYFSFHGWAVRFSVLVAKAREIQMAYRGRRDLARMDDRMLADIGVSRAQANAEANRRFWDLPKIASVRRGLTWRGRHRNA